jgi:hypothetical protein
MDIADGFSTFESLCEQLATDATSVRLSTVRAA